MDFLMSNPSLQVGAIGNGAAKEYPLGSLDLLAYYGEPSSTEAHEFFSSLHEFVEMVGKAHRDNKCVLFSLLRDLLRAKLSFSDVDVCVGEIARLPLAPGGKRLPESNENSVWPRAVRVLSCVAL